MDEINLFVSGISRQADARQTAAADEQRSNANWLRVISAVGALLIAAVVGGAAFILSRYTRDLRSARDEVAVLNAGLERRVGERTADLERARDKAEVLLREVNHRVANSLSIVSSFISMQARALGPEAKQALAETQDRIFAIGLIHKRLYNSTDVRDVALDEYLSGLLDHLQSSLRGDAQGTKLTYSLEPISTPTDAGVSVGVIVTEWVTNAFKYAYPEGTGEIRVVLRRLSDRDVELVVEDDGVGRPENAPAKGTGLGTRLVSAMASGMKATVEYRQKQPGTVARLVFATQQS